MRKKMEKRKEEQIKKNEEEEKEETEKKKSKRKEAEETKNMRKKKRKRKKEKKRKTGKRPRTQNLRPPPGNNSTRRALNFVEIPGVAAKDLFQLWLRQVAQESAQSGKYGVVVRSSKVTHRPV